MRQDAIGTTYLLRLSAPRLQFAGLSAAGIGFWFLVGFPFGNHNESYYWLAQFQHHGAWDIVSTSTLAATFRPLGQGLAYVGWQLSGGSSWPVQLFNFVVAAFALGAIALTLRETATFAVAMAVAGGAFFAGYIYLFHLHGVFYSPVLVVIAVSLFLEHSEGLSRSRRELATFACALTVGLFFHPYALILFLAYLAGSAIERWADSSSLDRTRWALLALVAALTLVSSRPHGREVLSLVNLGALVTSYRLTEISAGLALLAAAFTAVTVFGVAPMSRRRRIGLAAVTLMASGAFVAIGLPVILLWIASAIFKMAYLGKWSLAAMTAGAALLPLIAPSGSPTYAIFAVVMATIATAWGCSAVEQALQRLSHRLILTSVVLVTLVAGAVRTGVEVPIVSRLAQPLLAEREKTGQLEAIIQWLLASEYRNWRLAVRDTANPVDAGLDVIDRRSRPPTSQDYLDSYLASRGTPAREDAPTLLVTFGSLEKAGMTPVQTLDGRFAGRATVFK